MGVFQIAQSITDILHGSKYTSEYEPVTSPKTDSIAHTPSLQFQRKIRKKLFQDINIKGIILDISYFLFINRQYFEKMSASPLIYRQRAEWIILIL